MTNPNLDYSSPDRKSKYVGSGDAFSTRRPGDRLSLWNMVKMRWFLMKLKKVNIIPLVEVINLINKIDWISRARKNWEEKEKVETLWV